MARGTPAGASIVNAQESYVVPGFIDVHVHGIEGHDALDGAGAIAAIASRLPRYGVTAFCPTTVACGPSELAAALAQIADTRVSRARGAARVLPAHLESNFVNPEYRGAQPASCLRNPREALDGAEGAGRAGRAGGAGQAGGTGQAGMAGPEDGTGQAATSDDFDGADILNEITRAAPDVGIVTLASELDGGLDLIRWLVSRGHRVSLGHSAATYEEAQAAIAVGAQQATHLFNRMPPIHHRAPGLVGAVLQTDEVAAELVCDGFHVHPAMMQAAKRPKNMMATGPAGCRRNRVQGLAGR